MSKIECQFCGAPILSGYDGVCQLCGSQNYDDADAKYEQSNEGN